MNALPVTNFEVASGRIDAAAGVIHGVSVITTGEALGHHMQVDGVTLQQVAKVGNSFVGGVRVRFADEDHKGGAKNIVGTLRGFRVDGQQVRADLHLLKKSPDFDRIIEMAETIPDQFGLSIVFSGVHEMAEGSDDRLARCAELYSVDIVAMPAANPTGLFTAKPVDTAKEIEMKKDEQAKELEIQFAQTTAALKDAEAKLKADEEQFAVIVTEMSKLTTRVSELETQLATEQETGKQNADALQAAATEINDLKTKLAEAEKSAGEKAQAQLAAIGVAPVAEETPAKPESKTLADHISELQKISDERARAEYFSANIAPKLKH